MADIFSGLGGAFSGLSQGLQLLLMLRRAEEDRRLRERQVGVQESQEGREQQAFEMEQANAPYEDIQSQLNKANVIAALPDVRREYAPAPVEGTYNVPEAQFPEFGATGAAPRQRGGPPVVQDLETSHLAQVLERASRQSMQQRRQGTTEALLADAAKVAQRTQEPVAGAFRTSVGEQAELPMGFSVQPERTFSPYQMSSNREADRLATAIRMLRSRIPVQALNLLDLGRKPGQVAKIYRGAQADLRHLVELQAQYERAIGAVNPGAGQGELDVPAPTSGGPVGTSVVPGSRRQAGLTPNDIQRMEYDDALNKAIAQGQDPVTVRRRLGPRPTAP
ncbi:MAG: hypothetical protein L0Z53_06750 [Acidobacteriales bacterium]|nr:hypothetical protein [Terriglobales bacterium]